MVDAPSAPAEQERAPYARRWFLGWLISGIAAAITAAVGIPGVRALVGSAPSRRSLTTIQLGKLADYPAGQPKLAQFTLTSTDGWVRTLESRAVWVVRTSEDEVTVFNGRCRHLGCAYSWKTEGTQRDHFFCPCHDGVYTVDGTVVSGPLPRRLDTLPARVENGTVVMDCQDFRLGVSEKTPI